MLVTEHAEKGHLVSPALPRRAKTRRSAGKAAASERPKAYLVPYVEALSEARTPLGERRVSRAGAGG